MPPFIYVTVMIPKDHLSAICIYPGGFLNSEASSYSIEFSCFQEALGGGGQALSLKVSQALNRLEEGREQGVESLQADNQSTAKTLVSLPTLFSPHFTKFYFPMPLTLSERTSTVFYDTYYSPVTLYCAHLGMFSACFMQETVQPFLIVSGSVTTEH